MLDQIQEPEKEQPPKLKPYLKCICGMDKFKIALKSFSWDGTEPDVPEYLECAKCGNKVPFGE